MAAACVYGPSLTHHPHYPPPPSLVRPCGLALTSRQRLSYAIWPSLTEPSLDLRPVLEAASTAARLRLVLRRIRALDEREDAGGA